MGKVLWKQSTTLSSRRREVDRAVRTAVRGAGTDLPGAAGTESEGWTSECHVREEGKLNIKLAFLSR